MDYHSFISEIPPDRRQPLCNRLVDFLLTSKNDEKMPSQLAAKILRSWQQNTLNNESGMAALLEAAMLLEPEKTINSFNELQLTHVAEQLKTM